MGVMSLAKKYNTASVMSLLLCHPLSCGVTAAKQDTTDWCFGAAPLAPPTAAEVLGLVGGLTAVWVDFHALSVVAGTPPFR